MTPPLRACSAIVICLLLAATGLQAAERPPQRLYLVGDHWTAWEPPTSFPEGTEIYIIVRGDTLWDLAGRFYGNPYLWPQLWERNPYILDAHWIYPGDPLVVGIEVTPVEELAEAEPIPEPEEPVDLFASRLGPPVPLGTEDDIYCSGFIGDPEESFAYQIIGSEYENQSPSLLGSQPTISPDYGSVGTVKIGLSGGDVVYLDGGSSGGLVAGSMFTAIQPEELVQHPLRDEVVGRYYRYLGRVRVLSVQETTAIAEITDSCHPINVGAYLRPFEPEPIPLARRTPMRPINQPAPAEQIDAGGAIVLSDEHLVSLGQDHVVFIDRGAEDEVSPGDLYTIYRMNRPGLPPMVIGELAVLSVRPRTALAKILESRYTIYLGDRLDPK